MRNPPRDGVVREGQRWHGFVYGLVPVQGEGVIDGRPWYFRARGCKWSFSVADTEDGDPVDVCTNTAPGWGTGGLIGEPGGLAAGWISEDEALTLIGGAIDQYRRRRL
jgi:hypothetical protein